MIINLLPSFMGQNYFNTILAPESTNFIPPAD